ncbi:Hypothetical predicted protein [Cloeon dipterum]|uniref:Uncharacterized protein n=1 Tax=Cloeon dipterum TaxID=197152 RepID=A0A8S1DKH9_9INSE|nr:Hypothetical predicted protein [Cloeon dipterum]
MLQLTEKRLQNLRRRSLGLQQLAVRVISKKLEFYRTHSDELEKLKGLPGVLREKILQVLMKKRCVNLLGRETEFENLKVVFPLLLSSRTRYIELNGILSFCPDWFEDRKIEKVTQCCVELLKQIEIRAPQVETLIIQRDNPFYTEGVNSYLRNVEFNQDMVQSLMKMQKLNRLTVSLYCFNLTDLLEICKNLSRLQYINVGFKYHGHKNRLSPEEVSSSFCNLKEFIFEFPFNEWMSCLCTRNLPNIEVVQLDPNKIVDWIHLKIHSDRYHGLNFPGASNLRLIGVDLFKDKAKDVEAMPALFPKVTCLVVKNITSASLVENVMPKFDNVRRLHLLNPYGIEVIDKYLITYGQKLQALYLGNGSENSKISLESIFKCCPKLEKLSLLNVCLKPPSSKMDFFAELKELEWTQQLFLSSWKEWRWKA